MRHGVEGSRQSFSRPLPPPQKQNAPEPVRGSSHFPTLHSLPHFTILSSEIFITHQNNFPPFECAALAPPLRPQQQLPTLIRPRSYPLLCFLASHLSLLCALCASAFSFAFALSSHPNMPLGSPTPKARGPAPCVCLAPPLLMPPRLAPKAPSKFHNIVLLDFSLQLFRFHAPLQENSFYKS